MVKSLFITATGTDIGKTYISGLIVKKMRESGFDCGYYKPVLSGANVQNGIIVPGDCKHVVDISGLEIEPVKCLSYCFEEAVSPHLASKRAGVNIDIDKIKSDYTNLSKEYEYMLIEGAGGITCPIIDDKYLMWNLIKDLGTSVLVVADGGLGTINSVLITVEYIKNRNIKIQGLVLNNYDESSFMHRDNLEMVEKMTGLKVVATVKKDEKDININKNVLEGLFE
ncbi:dethiobiotin synthase [bacterium]|nr:dethiobiotin synthase [bacterium]